MFRGECIIALCSTRSGKLFNADSYAPNSRSAMLKSKKKDPKHFKQTSATCTSITVKGVLFAEAFNTQRRCFDHTISGNAFVTTTGEKAIAFGDNVGPFC